MYEKLREPVVTMKTIYTDISTETIYGVTLILIRRYKNHYA